MSPRLGAHDQSHEEEPRPVSPSSLPVLEVTRSTDGWMEEELERAQQAVALSLRLLCGGGHDGKDPQGRSRPTRSSHKEEEGNPAPLEPRDPLPATDSPVEVEEEIQSQQLPGKLHLVDNLQHHSWLDDSWLDQLHQIATSTVSYTSRASNRGGPGPAPPSRLADEELRYRMSGKPWNVEIRTAPSLYHRYHHRPTGRWTIISEGGVSRTVHSPVELAQLLLPLIEEALMSSLSTHLPSSPSHHPHSNDRLDWYVVRCQASSGVLTITTPDRVQLLWLQWGQRPCPHCPVWCQGEKGLWWHVQQQHDVSHHQALQESLRQRHDQALVIYRPHTSFLTTAAATSSSANPYGFQEGLREKPLLPWAMDAPAATESKSTVKNPQLTTNSGDHDIWECIKRGNLETLRRHVEQGWFRPRTDVDAKGATALLWAAGGGHLPMVRYLIEICQCDPNQRQQGRRAFDGRTALHWAARQGHDHVVRYLLADDRVQVEATTADGTTAWHWAAWQAHRNVMELLVQSSACRVDHTNVYGCNAALWAAQGAGTAETLAWLQQQGCPIDLVNDAGHGVLHKAAQRGRLDLCQWFCRKILEDTSNLSHRPVDQLLELIGPDQGGCTPSDLAGMENHTNLAFYLARQERELVVFMTSQGGHSSIPSLWKERAPVVVSNEEEWEPWAGVSRMLYALRSHKLKAY